MRQSHHTKSEILHLLLEVNAGLPISDVCKASRISERTFYRWRSRYGGMTPSASRELRGLQLEVSRLRAMVSMLSTRSEGPFVQASIASPRTVQRAETGNATVGRFAFVRGSR